jgi:hypothetical protein
MQLDYYIYSIGIKTQRNLKELQKGISKNYKLFFLVNAIKHIFAWQWQKEK